MFDFDDDDFLGDIGRELTEMIKPWHVLLFAFVLFGVLTYISWQAMVFAISTVGPIVGLIWWLSTP